MENLREAFKLRKDKQCAIMLDVKGPEVRTGPLENHKAIKLVRDQDLEISNLIFLSELIPIIMLLP